MKLNIGCGNDRKKGYLNCDISPEVNPMKADEIKKAIKQGKIYYLCKECRYG